MKNHVMKTNRAFKEFCVLGGLAYSVCGVAQERPNIIVFLVDDMGLMDNSVPFLTDGGGNRGSLFWRMRAGNRYATL